MQEEGLTPSTLKTIAGLAFALGIVSMILFGIIGTEALSQPLTPTRLHSEALNVKGVMDYLSIIAPNHWH